MKQASIIVKMKSVLYLNRVKLKINAKKKFGKLIDSWKLNNILLITNKKKTKTKSQGKLYNTLR